MDLWTPAEITTAFWIDASDSEARTLDGSLINQLDDKSGNGRHATGSGTTRPSLSSESVNGLDAADFSADSLTISGGLSLSQSMSVFSVFRRSSTGINSIDLGGSVSGLPYGIWWWTDNVRYSGLGSGSTYSTHGSAHTSTGVFLSGLTRDASNVVLRFFGQTVSTQSALSLTSASFAYVGRRASDYHSGLICEIIVVSGTVDTETRETIEGYLAHKWGLAGSLAADHPYKSLAPGAEIEGAGQGGSAIGAPRGVGGVPPFGDGQPGEILSAPSGIAYVPPSGAGRGGAILSAPKGYADTGGIRGLAELGPVLSAPKGIGDAFVLEAIGEPAPILEPPRGLGFIRPSGIARGGPVLHSATGFARLFPPLADDLPTAPTLYHCTLTGASDGVDDVTLPIKLFTVRHRVATRSYYQVVIPSYAYAADIAARPNGQVVITQTTGAVTEELMRGPVDDIRTDRGPGSQSITLSGNASRAAQERRTYVLASVLYVATDSEGNTRLRIAPRAAIRPGDAVAYDGIVIDVGQVSWSVAASQGGISATMEIATEPAEVPEE